MSDGVIVVELVDDEINLQKYLHHLDDPDVGAHGWFLGVTRRTTKNRTTDSLSYEAHHEMASRKLDEIAADAVREFGLFRLVIAHRLGEVPVGHASVLVGCCSPHRVSTFQALPWIMDRLKEEVPIWKCESYSDGTTEWVHPGVDDAS